MAGTRQTYSNPLIEFQKDPAKKWPRVREVKGLTPFTIFSIVFLSRLPFITRQARREAQTLDISRSQIKLPGLPSAFDGITIAFLVDFHCSNLTPPEFLRTVVRATNRLKPDLILLGGDYITEGKEYINIVAQVLSGLNAPLGIYSVLGNHDYWVDPDAIRAALRAVGVVDVTNSGRRITYRESSIRIAGVGDLWEDCQDLNAALDGVGQNEVVILLSHNPDYAVGLEDRRIKLVLSGHTHGGQIWLPGLGALITNSRYGTRLVRGLIPFEMFQLYVSQGIGCVIVPMRRNATPEITLLTLKA